MLGRRAAERITVQLFRWNPPLSPLPQETLAVARRGDEGFEVLAEKNPNQLRIFRETLGPGNQDGVRIFHEEVVANRNRLSTPQHPYVVPFIPRTQDRITSDRRDF